VGGRKEKGKKACRHWGDWITERKSMDEMYTLPKRMTLYKRGNPATETKKGRGFTGAKGPQTGKRRLVNLRKVETSAPD